MTSSHGPDDDLAPPTGNRDSERPLRRSLSRGWRRRCPSCGRGALMSSYLTVAEQCPSCGEALRHHRADDMPAWATIVVVGHIAAPSLLTVESALAPPLWIYWSIWPPATLALCLWLLPRIKGAVVAMQWAQRMHGFGDSEMPGAAGGGAAGQSAEGCP